MLTLQSIPRAVGSSREKRFPSLLTGIVVLLLVTVPLSIVIGYLISSGEEEVMSPASSGHGVCGYSGGLASV